MANTSGPVYKFGHHLGQDFASTHSLGVVGLIMGSPSDWEYVKPCADMLEKLKIPFEFGVVSAHRTPKRMVQYAHGARSRGLKVVIACAGGSAHLPGMTASDTLLPIFAVAPKKDDSHAVGSMTAMPAGVPLAYMGGGSGPGNNAGAVNAALIAARILALHDEALYERLVQYQKELAESVPFPCFDLTSK